MTMPKAKCPYVLFLICCLCVTAYAQSSTATLSGTVVDQAGAVVPGANVTVINAATGQQRQATTNDRGDFTVPLLPPATYTIRVERQGFALAEVSNLVLNVGDNKSLQIPLKAGNITEMVKITADAPLINESPAVGTVVDRQFVENMPLNGRSFQSLFTLTPGVVTSPTGSGGQGRFSVNGQRTDANAFAVDGVSANVFAFPALVSSAQSGGNLPGLTALGTTQTMVSIDAMQEFRVQTSTYSAEYGRQPGGQISISTRSGTNSFHGVLFDYLRNDVFDANDWFANRNGQPRPPEKQNDFGGTLGGPVRLPGLYDGRNRTFFFFSYEGLRLRLPQFLLANVPTLTLRQNAPVGLRPFLNAFPLPNGRDLGNGLAEFSTTYSDPSSLDATSIRLDHAITSRWTAFGRYNRVPSSSLARALSQLSATRQTVQSVTLGLTGGFTPNSSNELRFNYTSNNGRSSIESRDFYGATPVSLDAAIPSQFVSGNAIFSVNLLFAGLTTNVSPSVTLINGQVQNQQQINVVDNFSYDMGAHRLKFGLDFRRLTPFNAANLYRADLSYTTQQQVLNNSASGSFLANVPSRPIYMNFSAYGQDSWKVSRRFTLDLGLRWEVNPAPGEATGNDPLAVDQIDNLAAMQLAPRGAALWATTYNNIAPRVGVAYQIRQDAGWETVLRGGFGVFYDTGNEQGSRGFNSYPFRATASRTAVAVPLSSAQATPPVLPDLSNLTPPYGTIAVLDPRLKLPYTLQWNLAVQQSLGSDQALTLSYVGAAGRRLLQARQLSLGAINPKFTTVILTTNRATSDYHSLQAQFQRRLSHGLQALVSYTWSHALDFDSVDNGTILPVRGNAGFDLRHNFATAVTYDIPSPRGSRLLKAIFGQWSMDTSFHAQTAFPVDITGAQFVNPATGTLVAARANIVAGVPLYVDDSTVPGGRRINRAAFTVPPAGQFGNLGRNVLRGFGLWQQDFALRRRIKLTEQVNLQFRAEAFNIFNHPNFGAIQTTLSAANFGQATNMVNRQFSGAGQINQLYQIGGPRSLQFALKLEF